ncbi:MAG: tetratricopeptide repeat protein [Acidobacteriota bacterium]|nr:tetratricopeptide repeat protein [Acidobacteriota bacterium]
MQATGGRQMRIPLTVFAALAAVFLYAQTTLIEQGHAAMGRGETDAAIEVLERAVAQSPQSAEAHFALGCAYGNKVQASGLIAAAKYGSKIKDEFSRAVALDPRHVEARFGLVQVYAGAPPIFGGSYEKAFEQAKEIQAIDPIEGHRAYAFIFSLQKKPDLAEKEYAEAIREQPTSPRAHGDFGRYLANTAKNYTAASAELEAALKLDPRYMPAFYDLGRTASLASTNLDRGEEALKQYVACTPKANEPTLASAHYYLGTLYEKQGKKEAAKQVYLTALKLNPSLKQATEALKRVS